MSSYYSPAGKDVTNGTVSDEANINNLNAAIDSAFNQVEAAVLLIDTSASNYATIAQNWAEKAEDSQVTAGHYSALHHAAKASASASSASSSAGTATTQANSATASANTATSQAATATTQAGNAATSASTATTQAGIATTKASEAAASAIATAADVVLTHADVVLTHADVATMASAITTALQSETVAMANKTLTSPVFNTGVSGTAIDTTVTTSTTKIPRSGAVKTYVDTEVAVPKIAKGYAYYTTGELVSGTTVLPYDDTIPQVTEGVEFLTLNYTPTSATNILIIDIKWHGSQGNATVSSIVGALFVNGGADAVSATSVVKGLNDVVYPLSLRHSMVSGSTSLMSFTFRAGTSVTGTITMNGTTSSTRRLGGMYNSSITITEIVPS